MPSDPGGSENSWSQAWSMPDWMRPQHIVDYFQHNGGWDEIMRRWPSFSANNPWAEAMMPEIAKAFGQTWGSVGGGTPAASGFSASPLGAPASAYSAPKVDYGPPAYGEGANLDTLGLPPVASPWTKRASLMLGQARQPAAQRQPSGYYPV